MQRVCVFLGQRFMYNEWKAKLFPYQQMVATYHHVFVNNCKTVFQLMIATSAFNHAFLCFCVFLFDEAC